MIARIRSLTTGVFCDSGVFVPSALHSCVQAIFSHYNMLGIALQL